jgi:phosphonate transport system substrate-binding protein
MAQVMKRGIQTWVGIGMGAMLGLGVVACNPGGPSGSQRPTASSTAPFVKDSKALTLSAVPDLSSNLPPDQLKSRYEKMAKYLEDEIKVPVVYQPLADAAAVVKAFQSGDVDLAWVNGLAGVQARSPVEKAEVLAQRDTDERLASVFIANKASKIAPFREQAGLKALRGKTFTFGSEDSVSDRLLPQYFLSQAGIKPTDFKNAVGFAKTTDAVWEAVQAGTYDAGVISAKRWDQRVQQGRIDLNKLVLLWQTPAYNDYHWVIHPNVSDRLDKDVIDKVEKALLKLSLQVPAQKEILTAFGANAFIESGRRNYEELEKITKELNQPEEANKPEEENKPGP